jgi:signal peptidase I
LGDRPAAESGASVAEEDRATDDRATDDRATADPGASDSDQVGSGTRPEQAARAEGRQYTPQAVSRRPLGCLIEIAETLVLTIVIFWAIQTFVAQPYRVEQESMRTTLEPDQYVLVDKLTPRFDDYSRGDIVVFNPVLREASCTEPPTDEVLEQTPYIKRVIGEPGDSVELREGSVYVNGVQLEEPYIRGVDTEPLSEDDSWVVQTGRLFVMGDNRENSTDSRSDQIGEICVNDVVGRAWLRYWPLNTIGILPTPVYPDVPAAAEASN